MPTFEQDVRATCDLDLLQSGGLNPTNATTSILNIIDLTNTWIDHVGTQSVLQGTPCSISGL
jgi:hypothetical protein